MTVRAMIDTGVQRSFDDLGVPLAEVTFCVIDLETTGGDRSADRITEIGAVKVRGGMCLGTYQTLVNPGVAIPPKITVLTGLSDALVAPAPRVESVLPSLLEFIGDAVIVGHNVGFDTAFLRRALSESGRPPLAGPVVDTMPLSRRLLRDEVPNHRLGTLSSRLRLDHRPTHRALDDALATTDLLHLLLERAAGLGVLGLDDLLALVKLSGHPQAAKLALTDGLPRSPGVYMFRGTGEEILYVGKATNLRQRVRSYFGSEDRRKIGPMLRETRSVHHLPLPDPLTAEVIEQRLIARSRPRYNRRGTRFDKYCYVRLDGDDPWPRLSIVKRPSAHGTHLGPITSRSVAQLIVDALQSALPLRRCSARLGRNHVPAPDAVPCAAAQLGVAHCPCAGAADRVRYDEAARIAERALEAPEAIVLARLHQRMTRQASQHRFEDAAVTRDRAEAWLNALRRRQLVDALRRAGRVEIRDGPSTWVIEDARLLETARDGEISRTLPLAPPAATALADPPSASQIDEGLCLARFCDSRADRLVVDATGEWCFPLPPAPQLSRLDGAGPPQIDPQPLHVATAR